MQSIKTQATAPVNPLYQKIGGDDDTMPDSMNQVRGLTTIAAYIKWSQGRG
jgi:hypothetical protein